jgi:hypothetical protein
MTPRQRLAAGRIKVFDYMPYLASYVYGLKQVEVKGTGTCGVSKDGIIHWDAAFVERISPETLSYVLLHEVLHLVFRHHARAVEVYGTQPSATQHLAMNIAGDLVIEQTMACMRFLRPKGAVCLGADVPMLNMSLDFPPNQTMVEYYKLIMAKIPPQEDKGSGKSAQKDASSPGSSGRSKEGKPTKPQKTDGKEGSKPGEGGDGAVCTPGTGGSAGDGVLKDYEQTDESWEAFGELVAAGTAEIAMQQQELLNPGSVPGQLKETIVGFLRPQPNPFDHLRAAVSTSTASPIGGRTQTYRRLSRKQPMNMSKLRGLMTTQASACVIVDTSGSMGDRETKERALQVIADGLRRLKSVKVMCADTRIRSCSKLASAKNFEWVGGGGTRMDVALTACDEEQKPDSIVLITDGCTGWPHKQTRARVIVALTRDSDYRHRVPGWCKLVPLFNTKEDS